MKKKKKLLQVTMDAAKEVIADVTIAAVFSELDDVFISKE